MIKTILGKNGFSLMLLVILTASSSAISSCGGGDGNGSTSTTTPPYINATLVSFPQGSTPVKLKNATVVVQTAKNGSNITSATVSVNGVPLTYNPSANHNQYEGNVIISPGSTATLSVVVNGITYTASRSQFSSYPTIFSPLSGAIWSSTVVNAIGWFGGTPINNAVYAFGILNANDPNGPLLWPTGSVDNLMTVPINTTQDFVPANSINPGSGLVIVCIASNAFIPNASPNSILGIGGCNSVPIGVN